MSSSGESAGGARDDPPEGADVAPRRAFSSSSRTLVAGVAVVALVMAGITLAAGADPSAAPASSTPGTPPSTAAATTDVPTASLAETTTTALVTTTSAPPTSIPLTAPPPDQLADAALASTTVSLEPIVVAVPPEIRGATGEVLDDDELAAIEAEAASYVPPPPVPNRQPLRPPTIHADTPDPQLVAADGRYLLFSTNSGGFHVPVRISADLANWSEPTDALPVLPSWGRPGLTWAPSVAPIGGRWVMAVAVRSATHARHCIGLFVASSSTGPYRSTGGPVVCSGQGAIDPYLFVDRSGAYLYWKRVKGGGQQLIGATLDTRTLALSNETPLLASTQPWEGYGIENPAMVDAGGQLLLFYSGNWWTDRRYAIGYAECDGPLGPCHKVTIDRAWLSSGDGADGPGGQSFTTDGRGQVWMGYHAWVAGIGYQNGGHRPLHAEPLRFERGRPVLVNRRAEGAFDAWLRAPGGVIVGGWAGDVDHRQPTTVEVLVDGTLTAVANTGWERPDVAAARPDLGQRRGFAHRVPVPAGAHEVCVRAVDDLRLSRTPLGCRSVTIDPTPTGALESASSPRAGHVEVRGWAIDPDVETAIGVRVLVDGVERGGGTADREHAVAAASYPAHGGLHGFVVSIDAPGGERTVCVEALDSAGGPPTRLGCRTVVVAAPATTTPPPIPTTAPTTTSTTTTTSSPTTTSTTTSTTSTTTTTTTTTEPPASTSTTSTTDATTTTGG